MSTKKVKNASESAKVNKGFGAGTKPKVTVVEKKEVERVGDLVDTIDSKLEVTTKTEVADTSDLIDAVAPDTSKDLIDPDLDVDFNFGDSKARGTYPKPDRTQRQRGGDYNDDPIVYIAGTKREPAKMDKEPANVGSHHYYRSTSNPLEVAGMSGQRFAPDDITLKERIRWYHVALPEIDVYITQGSELTIDDRITAHCGWEGDEGDWIGPKEGQRPELFIIGSVVKCRSLSMGSVVKVNNSTVETSGHIDAINARIFGCRINAFQSIDLFYCGLYTSRIDSANRFMLRHSNYIRNLSLGGFDFINLSKIHNTGSFRIHAAWSPTAGLGLDIADCHLTEFSADFMGFTEIFGKQYGTNKPWQGNGLYIRRRVDYGYFAGATPVPFVRCGDYNIATPHNLFLADEIDTVSFPKEKQELTYQPQFGVGLRPYGEGYSGLGDDNSYTMGLRGGKLWEKARKDCFGNNPNRPDKKRPIGAIGDNLVQSLVDQIKSRVKLYVEMAVLTEV